MHILVWYPEPGNSGATSSEFKLVEAYCRLFPDDELTVLCAPGSPLAELGSMRNCRIERVGRYVPREAYLLGTLDLVLWRRHCRDRFDVFWSTNTGNYFHHRVPQVLFVKNAFQVYSREIITLHPASAIRVLLLRWFFRRSLRLSSAVMAETPLMGRYLKKISGCPARVVVVPKAVVADGDNSERPMSERIARLLEGTDGVAKLLYVAASYPHKNHKVLAGMMDQFRQKGAVVRLVVTISTEEWQRVAGPDAGSLVESGHVIPLGWVDKEELGSLYKACDLCVMPSLLESLSSANIEAMYWKRPQIAADLPYSHDLCGDSALYASPHEPTDWRDQVERLLEDVPLRELLVTKGVARLSDFPKNWEMMAERVREVLAGVVANPDK
jgi:glycosyltransferase involved in cell wall biosynthesis